MSAYLSARMFNSNNSLSLAKWIEIISALAVVAKWKWGGRFVCMNIDKQNSHVPIRLKLSCHLNNMWPFLVNFRYPPLPLVTLHWHWNVLFLVAKLQCDYILGHFWPLLEPGVYRGNSEQTRKVPLCCSLNIDSKWNQTFQLLSNVIKSFYC